jgi:hypothetical protein
MEMHEVSTAQGTGALATYITLRRDDAAQLLAAIPALGTIRYNRNGVLSHMYITDDRLLNDVIDLCLERGWCAHIFLAGGSSVVWITDDGEMARWRCINGRPVLDVDFVLDLLHESKDVHEAAQRLVAATHPDVRHRVERMLYGKTWPDDPVGDHALLVPGEREDPWPLLQRRAAPSWRGRN